MEIVELCDDPECEESVCALCGIAVNPDAHLVLWQGQTGLTVCRADCTG